MKPLVVSRIILVQNLVLNVHDSTSAIFTSILSHLSGRTQPIEVMISDNRRKTISDNRKKLIPIVILL